MKGTFSSLAEAQAYFRGDRFATEAGITLDELTDEKSVCSLTLNERHRNANGGVMGGAIFTLADLAFAALASQIHQPTVAQTVSINYFSAPKGERLIAEASLLKNGRTSTVLSVKVRDDTGRDVALFTGTGFKL